jgi:glycosyltransferase involved in cell wall biosynthesis
MEKISIILPARDAQAYVRDALNSVLRQTYGAYEIIAVDDGSTDGTRRIMEEFSRQHPGVVKCVFQDGRGPSAARNAGIREAEGSLIAFLDADDVWRPRKLELQAALLAARPEAGFVYCDNEFVDRERRPIRDYIRTIRLTRGDIAGELFDDFFLITSAVMLRKSCLAAVGLFREDIPVGEDYEFFLRLAYRYPAEVVKEKLLERRVHAESLSRRDPALDVSCDLRTLTAFVREHPDFYRQRRAQVKERLSSYFFSLGYFYLERGERGPAFRNLVRSLGYRPNRKALKSVLAAFFPRSLVRRLRRRAAPQRLQGSRNEGGTPRNVSQQQAD